VLLYAIHFKMGGLNELERLASRHPFLVVTFAKSATSLAKVAFLFSFLNCLLMCVYAKQQKKKVSPCASHERGEHTEV